MSEINKMSPLVVFLISLLTPSDQVQVYPSDSYQYPRYPHPHHLVTFQRTQDDQDGEVSFKEIHVERVYRYDPYRHIGSIRTKLRNPQQSDHVDRLQITTPPTGRTPGRRTIRIKIV